MVRVSKRGGKSPRRRRYRRRAIVLHDVVSVRAYLTMVAQDKVEASIPCPDGCHGKWGRHSRFTRQWVDYDCLVCVIVIVRVRCSDCGGVWSLFPAFVWYRFRFCHRLVQSACWSMLDGASSTAVSEQFEARLSSVVEERCRYRVPAESTLRFWLHWLGQRCLERLLAWTRSLIAQWSAAAARALPVVRVRRDLSAAARSRKRAEGVLRLCALLDAVGRGRTHYFRRSPNQLRDWARTLFRERRALLARPP